MRHKKGNGHMPINHLIASAVSLYPLYRVVREDLKELVGVGQPHEPSPRPSPPRPRPKPAFRQAHPGGRLLCQLTHLDEQAGIAVYRCTAITESGTVSTSYGYGYASNDPLYVEHAEQEAIRKAKEGLGYSH